MPSNNSNNSSVEHNNQLVNFEQVRYLVEQEFSVVDSLMEYGAPTFHVKLSPNSKKAFLKVMRSLDPLGLVPTLKKVENKIVLRVRKKQMVAPSKHFVNIVLLLITVGTTLVSGYFSSLPHFNPIKGAVMFTGSVIAVLGIHEVGHIIAARKHGIEATAPYFLPGPPLPLGGFGTFGALILIKSPAPNKDSLFDLGSSGPIIGFIVTIFILIVGITMSLPIAIPITEMPPYTLPTPLLIRLLIPFLIKSPPVPSDYGLLLYLHPVAFAGWIGLLATMLNLIPAGTLDGGHAARGSLGRKARMILSVIAIAVLVITRYYLMAIIALFLSLQRHPGPLDDVSSLSTSRKLVSILLVLIFLLCTTPIQPFW